MGFLLPTGPDGSVMMNNTNPAEDKPITESLVDTTNLAANTYYYPAATGASMRPHGKLSLTGKIIDADGTMTITVEATNDEDTASGDWKDITKLGLLDDNTDGNANITVTNGTVTFAIQFRDMNFEYYRVKEVNDGATNTLIIKQRKAV